MKTLVLMEGLDTAVCVCTCALSLPFAIWRTQLILRQGRCVQAKNISSCVVFTDRARLASYTEGLEALACATNSERYCLNLFILLTICECETVEFTNNWEYERADEILYCRKKFFIMSHHKA